MNKKGLTILELLVSITLVAVVILLLIRVMFSLDKINNDTSYASSDEIDRLTIIKEIENDFLEKKLKDFTVNKLDNKTVITFNYQEGTSKLEVYKEKLVYNDEAYVLSSKNATYDLCLDFSYEVLDQNYYAIKLNIPVLIKGVNTTINDDVTLTYLDLIEDNNYPSSNTCVK